MSIGSGLVLGVRGIVGKEVRSRTRGYWRPMLQVTLYLGLVTLAVVAVLGVSLSSTGTLSPTLGETLFSALAAGSVLLIAFMAPGLTAGSISSERERLTLDLLLVTRASPLGLVAGKLAGALLWIAYLLIASLPALAVVNLFGGVPWSRVAAALTVTAATALSYTALGLVLSAVLRRTVLATVLAYAGVLITVIVAPVLAASLSAVSAFSSAGASLLPVVRGASALGLPPLSAWLTFVSPVSAIISVLGGTVGPLQGGAGSGIGLFATYLVRANGPTNASVPVTSLAPWAFYTLLSVLFGIGCLLIAAVAIRPVPLWRVTRTTSDR
jgi:ABC-type transport system involved in multi-copper enzyme maturation permease subunit